MTNDFDKLAGGAEPDERPLIDAAWAQFETLSPQRKPSSTGLRDVVAIPGYRILREVHRGGQGVVYQAVQESTQRKVAIKIIKEGPFADPTELARFDREVDVLSRLNHPHIVAIYDRGLTAGHAYYVMDYIPGRPLDAYVVGAALSSREVLALFYKVCEAVNVAHLRGVIHRDLKPGNICIDEEGEPHILDFGLAKLAKDASGSADGMTVTGQFVGSLPWASPEQAEGRSDLLDVRADVYSLGVILYHLLTCSFPYPVSGRMSDVVQSIIRTSPARPSALARNLDRDVEVILLKCLAKDPERRYQSAGELARDIERYLNGEPIEARPATTFYQVRQFARRNKGLVASLIAVILILAGSTTVSIALALREATARAQTRAVADFQAKMLADIDPRTMGVKLRADLLTKVRAAAERSGSTPEAIEPRLEELENLITGIDLTGMALTALNENVFQNALTAVEKQFADQPVIRAQLLQTVASTQRKLGLLDAATQPQELALTIRRRVLGDEHPDTLTSIGNMGELRLAQGKLAGAEPYLREAAQGLRRVRGGEHPDTLAAITNMGDLRLAQGKLVESEALYREVIEKARRVLGDRHPDTLASIANLGRLLQEQDRLSEAEPYLYEVLNTRRRVLGEEHPDTLASIHQLGLLIAAQGKFEEAEGYLRESLEKHRRVLGNEHPNTLSAIMTMGFVLRNQGRLAEVEAHYQEALEKRRRLLGDEHPDTVTSIHNIGFLLLAQGKPAEAEPYCREAMENWRRLLGDEHPDTLIAINNMGLVLLAQGRLSEAEPYCREALEKRRRVRGEQHLDTLVSTTNMGALLLRQDKPAEVIALMAPLEPAAHKAFTGGNVVRLGRFLTPLGRAQAATGEFAAAEANLTEAYAILGEAKGATDRDFVEVLTGLAELYDIRHSAEPDGGYQTKATEWRARLAERKPIP